MFNCNYSHARGNLASLLEMAVEQGVTVEITRRKGDPAILVSKEEFERYRNAALDAEFADIISTHGEVYKELADR
ncbi:type II toxin-antitoxin system Phd/YefM family antitoxin [Escherichia marmotae]|uniref:type II toxin-antitoxin system Phd/YefM family antitoxin n=1 Tax=Escherichia marmotae TaxID=1499973 RepID=UPI000571C752|nr:type II toxin-antitoxin system Phd/YefM family antitoxin [Escherichia marmotae]EFB2837699.1 type II toxin-antitoxin system Phd/YefM family antitoxin [Escherichia coli]AUT30128.1 type II toxin-antitoxin system Phd/YefM family antitoxin [Escherichia marmotae]EGF7348247.1 type II toxin-antitoxin system Phd/YefM family antitoxin [Escherichia coli]EGF7413197.1 type II toxin-antitoxin system Phd/YefM family antitoxin [Escherichia coli]EGF7454317.1 type II toxin-antitoxin system Phd/YefM family an